MLQTMHHRLFQIFLQAIPAMQETATEEEISTESTITTSPKIAEETPNCIVTRGFLGGQRWVKKPTTTTLINAAAKTTVIL